jgi:hypothetical protein
MDTEFLTLDAHFIALGIPDVAKLWLKDVYSVIQGLDDLADGDRAPDRAHAEDLAYAIFVRMPLNEFFQKNASVLVPVLAVQVTKWCQANNVEEAGQADERSFMWRAGYYDLVSAVCLACGMMEAAKMALLLYGETYENYREEFKCPVQQ